MFVIAQVNSHSNCLLQLWVIQLDTDVEVKKQRGEGKGLPRYSCSHRD